MHLVCTLLVIAMACHAFQNDEIWNQLIKIAMSITARKFFQS